MLHSSYLISVELCLSPALGPSHAAQVAVVFLFHSKASIHPLYARLPNILILFTPPSGIMVSLTCVQTNPSGGF